jgi:hypothetical protein
MKGVQMRPGSNEALEEIPVTAAHAAHLERVALYAQSEHSFEGRMQLLPVHNAKIAAMLSKIDMAGVTCAADVSSRLRKMFAFDARFIGRGIGCVEGYSREQIAKFNAARREGK